MRLKIGQLLLFACQIHFNSAQVASMVEGVLQVLYKKDAKDYDALISRKRSSRCQWSEWGPCIWANGDAEQKKAKYMKALPSTCQQHWFYRLVRRTYGTAVNNVFDYVARTIKDKEPCGFCAYRQSCGYGGPDKCNQNYRGNRPSIIPLHINEQVCQTSRGLSKPQDVACSAERSVLELNNPRDPCQIWPAVEENLKLPGLPQFIKDKFKLIEWVRCVPDRESRKTTVRSAKSRMRGKKYASVCRCCCFPWEPKLVPQRVGSKLSYVYKCRRIPGIDQGKPRPKKPQPARMARRDRSKAPTRPNCPKGDRRKFAICLARWRRRMVRLGHLKPRPRKTG